MHMSIKAMDWQILRKTAIKTLSSLSSLSSRFPCRHTLTVPTIKNTNDRNYLKFVQRGGWGWGVGGRGLDGGLIYYIFAHAKKSTTSVRMVDNLRVCAKLISRELYIAESWR